MGLKGKGGTQPRVIGVASGKGGVGKTSIAVTLATVFAEEGRRTLLLDADMGLANSQILLGCSVPRHMGHVLEGKAALEDILVEVRPNLHLVPGASGVKTLGALDETMTHHVIRAFSSLDRPVDVMIVDIAAGISPSVLTFLRACQQQLIVMKDEFSSIADAYGLVKVLAEDLPLAGMALVPNGVESQGAGERLHAHFSSVCERFFGQGIRFGGCVRQDSWMGEAQRRQQPLVALAPSSQALTDIRHLAQKLYETKLGPLSGDTQFFFERQLAAPVPA
ncbi:MAG: AAA family ATPase [Pseudomonadales bacterium]